MKAFFSELLRAKAWLLIVLYLLTSYVIRFTDLEFVKTDELYYEFLAQKAESKYDDYNEYMKDFEEDFDEFGDESEEGYTIDDLLADAGVTAFDFISSILVTALLLMSGFQLHKQFEGIGFSVIFKSALLGKFSFLLKSGISIAWFLLVQPDHTFEDVINFHPFSLYPLFEGDSTPLWLYSFLRSINIFQVLFCFIVAYCLRISYNFNFWNILKWTAIIYFLILGIREALWIFIDLALL